MFSLLLRFWPRRKAGVANGRFGQPQVGQLRQAGKVLHARVGHPGFPEAEPLEAFHHTHVLQSILIGLGLGQIDPPQVRAVNLTTRFGDVD